MTKLILAVALQKRVNALRHASKLPTVRYKTAFVLRLMGCLIFMAGIILALLAPVETMLEENFFRSFVCFGVGIICLILGQVDKSQQKKFYAELEIIKNQVKP